MTYCSVCTMMSVKINHLLLFVNKAKTPYKETLKLENVETRSAEIKHERIWWNAWCNKHSRLIFETWLFVTKKSKIRLLTRSQTMCNIYDWVYILLSNSDLLIFMHISNSLEARAIAAQKFHSDPSRTIVALSVSCAHVKIIKSFFLSV